MSVAATQLTAAITDAPAGHWMIQGTDGRVWFVSPEEFAAGYEPLPPAPPPYSPRPGSDVAKVLAELRAAGPVRPQELAARLQMKEMAVGGILTRLVAHRAVERLERGVYQAAPEATP